MARPAGVKVAANGASEPVQGGAHDGRFGDEANEFRVCRMGTELILKHESAQQLEQDFQANLRKGRAFVPGASGLGERELCTLRLEPPGGGEPLSIPAEAVWIDARPGGGTGLSFIGFDAIAQSTLAAFVSAARVSAEAGGPGEAPAFAARDADEAQTDEAPIGAGPDTDVEPTSSARHLHDRIRELDIAARDVVARQGSLPERVALERRYGSSVWEGLLHNPQITPREVLRMAKSTSLPSTLVNLIVNNRAWLADPAVNQALLDNPRLSGPHIERVLRLLPQAELARVAERTSVRMQVRQAAKRLIRR